MGSIRLFLAIIVYASHVEWFGERLHQYANVAVFCFFVISGFVVGLVANNKYANVGVYRFFLIRWRSLYGYYVTVIMFSLLMCLGYYLIFGIIVSPYDRIANELSAWSALELVSYFLALNFFIGLNIFGWQLLPIQPSWTLGIEAVSWVVIYLMRRVDVLRLAIVFFFFILLNYEFDSSAGIWYGMHYFILGMIAFKVREDANKINISIGRNGCRFLICIFLLVFIVEPLVTPYAMSLLIIFLNLRDGASKMDNYLGDISYPFYLLHVPCFKIASFIVGRQSGGGSQCSGYF